MRMILRWIDKLRRTTPEELPSFCAALVQSFEEIAAAANSWASIDHNSDGTHDVVRFKATTAPPVTTGAISVYWDGTNLKYLKPDGTSGNIV